VIPAQLSSWILIFGMAIKPSPLGIRDCDQTGLSDAHATPQKWVNSNVARKLASLQAALDKARALVLLAGDLLSHLLALGHRIVAAEQLVHGGLGLGLVPGDAVHARAMIRTCG
jgi:hypothetical protein